MDAKRNREWTRQKGPTADEPAVVPQPRDEAYGWRVPKGLNDRSDSTELAEVQAIHFLEWMSKKDPSG